MLFHPQKSPSKNASRCLLQLDPIFRSELLFIKSMLATNPFIRPGIAEIRTHIGSITATSFNNGRRTLRDINLSFSFETGQYHSNFETVHQIEGFSEYFNPSVYSSFPSTRSLRDGISAEIHDQKQSQLCWSFAIASGLSFAVASFVFRSSLLPPFLQVCF